jgi:hypothetical protein
MKTIVEEALEINTSQNLHQKSSNELNIAESNNNNFNLIHRISSHKENGIKIRQDTGVDEEIYQFIEDIHRQNLKAKNTKANQIKSFYPGKERAITLVDGLNDKNNKKVQMNLIGLSDNNTIDSENKSKAQKGLLLLLNKMSNGDFMPEIKSFFDRKNEEKQLQTKESKNIIHENISDEEELITEKKRMTRQTNINKSENFENKEEEMNIVEVSQKYKGSNNIPDEKITKAGAFSKHKIYEEDDGKDLYDRVLIVHFSKKEASEYAELRKGNNDEDTFKIKLNSINDDKIGNNVDKRTSKKKKF